MMRIHTKALALSSGVVCGGAVFIMTLLGTFFDYGLDFLVVLRSVYPGYSISIIGSIIGLLYGFLDGVIWFGLIGWFYNRIFVRL
jgi:hypothetical protein